jgi:hypothetical protein
MVQRERKVGGLGNDGGSPLVLGRRGNGFWKIQIQLDFFLLDFVGLDYFGCGCPHVKLNWMSNQYWMSKQMLLSLMSDSGRGSRI